MAEDMQAAIDAAVAKALAAKAEQDKAAAEKAEAVARAEMEAAYKVAEERLAAEVAAADKAHAERMALLGNDLALLADKLRMVDANLWAAADKAQADPSFFGQAKHFVERGHALVDEWSAWIARSL